MGYLKIFSVNGKKTKRDRHTDFQVVLSAPFCSKNLWRVLQYKCCGMGVIGLGLSWGWFVLGVGLSRVGFLCHVFVWGRFVGVPDHSAQTIYS